MHKQERGKLWYCTHYCVFFFSNYVIYQKSHGSLKWSEPAGPTFSLQQRRVQQLHHVLDLCVQLRHVTLSHHISQHWQEVIGTVHPPWKEADREQRGRWVWWSHRSDRGSKEHRGELNLKLRVKKLFHITFYIAKRRLDFVKNNSNETKTTLPVKLVLVSGFLLYAG